ncbi:hypothetical protein GGF32_005193 [Allomyces javanicus]|nr:hypothetical protein GGF32_005193 [Allomyces javanicus]
MALTHHCVQMTVMFAVRVSGGLHAGTHARPVQVCEPVVLAPDYSTGTTTARSLMDTFMLKSGLALPFVRTMIGVTPKLADLVRAAGGIVTLVPNTTGWYQDVVCQDRQAVGVLNKWRNRNPADTRPGRWEPITAPPAPDPAVTPSMIRFLGKLSGASAADMVRRALRWRRRLDQILVRCGVPQYVHLDESKSEISFYMRRGEGMVWSVMCQSGVVIGGARIDFEPADPRDAIDRTDPHALPPERSVFILVNPPFVYHFNGLVEAMRAHGLCRLDADLNYDMKLPGTNVSYGFLSMAPDAIGHAEDLDRVVINGKRMRVVPLHHAKTMFADPSQMQRVLQGIAEQVLNQ